MDIETTTYRDVEKSKIEGKDCYNAITYHIQLCIQGKVIFCRTYQQLSIVLDFIKDFYGLNENKKLVCYIHNLSFEFQHLFSFFTMSEVFATDNHKVLRCIMDNVFELRCSYFLTNMSLKKLIENTPNAVHYKGTDDLDYRVMRTPTTALTDIEYGYCYNDVMGLYEGIMHLLTEDNLYTIPMTSTGYVRRDCRKAMQKNKKNKAIFHKMEMNDNEYTIVRKCFRGGNTASSRYRANKIEENVSSYDISSSYPYVMLAEKYPMSKWATYGAVETVEELDKINEKYCTCGKYVLTNVKVKDDVPIPYIPVSKCEHFAKQNNIAYNGRILSADFVEIYLTNVDFDIVKSQYEYDDIYISDMLVAQKDYLPLELRQKILEYFFIKSKLKGDNEHYYEYMKAKNKLNAIYGMCVTDILHSTWEFEELDGFIEKKETDLTKYYKSKNSFLSYQWGVFVTAYARRNLQRAIDVVGLDTVYCDTDSVKYVDNHTKDFDILNKGIMEYCDTNNIVHSTTLDNGKTLYLGIWDREPQYDYFITLGAKKYAYEIDGKIGLTVSGLNKQKGAEELQRKGGLDYFTNTTVFADSGRTCAYYNFVNKHIVKLNGEEIENGSNIAIVDVPYTLGITDTMLDIIDRSLL